MGTRRASQWLACLAFISCTTTSDDLFDDPSPVGGPRAFVVYTNDPTIQAQLDSWVTRWRAATGINIRVQNPVESIKPIPVTFAPHILSQDGTEACGLTTTIFMNAPESNKLMWWQPVKVELAMPIPPGCPDWEETLGHELAHVMSGTEYTHAKSGVFMNYMSLGMHLKINEDTLQALCEHALCLKFQAEKD